MIRVFKSASDYGYYRARSRQTSHYVPNIDEVCLAAEESGQKVGQLGDLYAGLFHHFLNDKHEHLPRHVPRWIEQGVRQYLNLTRPKGKQLLFEVSQGERERINGARRDKNLLSARALMYHDHGGLDASGRNLRYQRGRYVRFLLDRKEDWLVGLLPRYYKAVKTAQKDHYLAPLHPGAGTPDPDTADKERKKRDVLRGNLRETVNSAVVDWPSERQKRTEKLYTSFNKRI